MNVVEGAGWYGFDGIRKWQNLRSGLTKKKKKWEDLVVRKGMGVRKPGETDIQIIPIYTAMCRVSVLHFMNWAV